MSKGQQQRKRIVAEISLSWPREDNKTVSKLFEDIIATNDERGYDLESWKMTQTFGPPSDPPRLFETIIAVFKLRSA